MPYNENLAIRVRSALAQFPDVEEKQRMGGLSFMRNGKVLARVQNDELMVRCRPEETEELLTKTGARRFTVKGKTNMKGWLLIDPQGTKSQEDLNFWMGVTIDFNTNSSL